MDNITITPVPEPVSSVTKGTPKDVFLHLLAVATLYVSVIAFIALWWEYISILFPDFLQSKVYYVYSSYYDSIRLAMAALLVVFPIHILISWLLGREFRVDPVRRDIRIRKWLWYITLFVSAVTIIIDLIILINNFLKGDLTTQFFLKIFVTLIVAGAVFGYYLWDLRKREAVSSKPRMAAWAVSLVIFASIVYGFFLIGSPNEQRTRRIDEQKVNNLSTIQNEIINYWQAKGSLPSALEDLNNQISGFTAPKDPETDADYEYKIKSNLAFSLCADFKTSSNDSNSTTPRAIPYGSEYYPYNQNWNHDKGHVCFERTIDPEIYKPSVKTNTNTQVAPPPPPPPSF